jgi:hypothetical protein
MPTLKRFAASLALSLALLFTAQPVLAQRVFHCIHCEYLGTFYDSNGDAWDLYDCYECHFDEV